MTKPDEPSVPTIIVGHANTFHDPAIAVLAGDVVYAEAFERHLQCKRSIGSVGLFYSTDILHETLTRLGVLPVEKAEIVYRTSWAERGLDEFNKRRAESPLEDRASYGEVVQELAFGSLRHRIVHETQLDWVLRGARAQTLCHPREAFPPTEESTKPLAWTTKLTQHHLAHIANAVYTSPFDECVVMVSDAVAEGASLGFHHFANNEFRPLTDNEDDSAVSLGQLYFRLTELCGFDPWKGEEWKVMGLAAYGKPDARIRALFESTFEVRDLALVRRDPNATWVPELEKVVGAFRRPGQDPLKSADLAHNFQAFYTDTVLALLRNAAKLGLSKNLAISGGSGLNSTTNGRIVGATGFERVHVPSAPADDGNALGAALYEKHYIRKEPRRPGIMSPYLGSYIDIHNLERILSFGGIDYWEAPNDEALCQRVAKILAAAKIIGWVQGRAEFGPRALGNRSILADPRPRSMKDEINRRVKFREQYRPVAPSILHEHGPEYFENYQESPYMERTLSFRPEVRDLVPAVVHVDGTGRLQTVKKEYNALFYGLITEFKALTGVPILLNTSFNVMGKPIVHGATDAVAVFYTTDLDYLVVGKYVLRKRANDVV
jgi:carbamoyltransferase